MATSGATPPVGDSPKPKREITPEQKRTFTLLGVAGALALIVGAIYLPGLLSGGSGGASTPPASDTVAANTASAPAPSPAASGGEGGGAGRAPVAVAAPVAPAVVAVPAAFVSRARVDPFEPVLLVPPPAPPPPRPTPKPTPIPTIPDPRVVVRPPSGVTPAFAQGSGLISIANPRLRAEVARPLGLPAPRFTLNETGAPRNAFPPPRTSGTQDNSGSAPQQSYDKRLAGVLIGDGVRALLEVSTGAQVVTYNVAPGEEVNGIRVLSIERFREGDRTVTRMLVRDTDGAQRTVELKAAPAQTGATGAEGAPGGP